MSKRRSLPVSAQDMLRAQPRTLPTFEIISLGAGVQSSTMALMAARGLITPMPLAAIFADTGDEPRSVYNWLDQLEQWLPFPVFRVQKGVLSQDMIQHRARLNGSGTYVRQSIPAFVEAPRNKKNGEKRHAMLTRGCTRDYKIRPIVTFARMLKRYFHARSVTQWYGISTDEAQRRKEPTEHDLNGRWPLIEQRMSREDCLAWMATNGYPVPPRSACIYCPFHSDAEWLRLQRDEPQEFMRAVAIEKALQLSAAGTTKPTTRRVLYLHDSLKPLDQVVFTISTQPRDKDCSGHCGV